MPKIDLHLHSSASDGRLPPADLVQRSVELGLSVIAITDHDTVDGIVPALIATRAFPQLTFIPGIEISTDVPDGEVHVLGYFIDHVDNELLAALAKLRDSRWERALGMVTKLGELGIHIDWQRVREIAGSSTIGRPHIAQAMLERGHIRSIKEAFVKYIGRNGPAYVEREKITPAESVELINHAHGLAVLAHPFTAGQPEALIAELKRFGLVGVETYYDGYSEEEIGNLAGLADKYNLVATGGSDYHGLDISETVIGGTDVPQESVDRLMALSQSRGKTRFEKM